MHPDTSVCPRKSQINAEMTSGVSEAQDREMSSISKLMGKWWSLAVDTTTIPNTARYYQSLTLQRTPHPRAGTREGSEGLLPSYVDKKSLNFLSP